MAASQLLPLLLFVQLKFFVSIGCIADILTGWRKPDAADASPNRCAGEGPNGGPETSSTSKQEDPSACMRQSVERVGGEKKRRRLGRLGQRKLSRWRGKEAEQMATKHEGSNAQYILRSPSDLVSP